MFISTVPMEHAYARVSKPAFDLEAPRFEPRWWDTEVREAPYPRDVFYRWTVAGREAVRAHIHLETKIGGDYVGIGRMLERAVDIPFFEVRADLRRQGFGRLAIEQLGEIHPDRILTAFSEQADKFWGSLGWAHLPRADRDTMYSPLFVRFPDRPSM